MSPVGRLVFKTSEVHKMCLVGSTPTSSAIFPDARLHPGQVLAAVLPHYSLTTNSFC